jgi:UDP-N-acetylglucosamine:LPS N-acetylglucosamine transferase
MPNLRHLVIQGPKFEQSIRALDGMTVIPYEPEIGNLIAISSLVISEGGYNTVHEIRLAKTPAIFLPTAKHYDDQEARVRELERRGLAVVYTDRSPAPISQKILELAGSPSGLTVIKKKYIAEQMVLGNRAAAEKILELVA